MTAELEYEGKNLDKAVQKAADALEVDPEQLDYDVLSHGSSGIFGLAGVKKARIRVNLPEKKMDAARLVDRLDQELSGPDPGEAPQVSPRIEPEDTTDEPVEEPAELAFGVLKRIVDTISDNARISLEQHHGALKFSVNGTDAALLIGKRGQTLEAIQTLVEKVVNKHNADNGKIRVQVDVEDYLKHRQENLEKLALKLAAKCKRIGKPIALGQMNAYERRIIHLVLKKDPEVRTKSKGEGYLRKLVIFPKKKSGPGQPN